MKFRSYIIATLIGSTLTAFSQVASHAPVASHGTTAVQGSVSNSQISSMATKPVARVNGAVLTEIDLTREMYSMFPYAQQHGGVPKSMEPEIRKGALEMIVFEELLYQEGKRRKIQVPAERLTKALADFKKQFPTTSNYEQYLKIEFNGSPTVLKEKIRRSLLIEQMLKTEVAGKSVVSLAAAREYYNKNPQQFQHGESFAIQTISIIPPENASSEIIKEAKAKITDALRLAKATKTAREFGLLAEQLSDDDWRMKLGDRGNVPAEKLPPEVVRAARTMKKGQVSNIIPLGRAYVIFRLNLHTPAGKTPFLLAKKTLISDLRKQKITARRTELNQQLHKGATIEVL